MKINIIFICTLDDMTLCTYMQDSSVKLVMLYCTYVLITMSFFITIIYYSLVPRHSKERRGGTSSTPLLERLSMRLL